MKTSRTMKGRKLIIGLVVVATVIGSMAMPVSAATITVNPDGSADYTTIQAAVDAAASGDVIEVEPGTYYETVYVETEDITIQSAGDGDVNIVANRANGTVALESDSGLTTPHSEGDNVNTYDQDTVGVGTGSNGDYGTVQEAVNNTSDGDKVVIAPGTYNESVTVESNYTMFISSDTSQEVTIDGSNTSEGEAIVDSDVEGTYVHDSVETVSGVLGGGGGSIDGLDSEIAGIPVIVWLVIVGLGAYVMMNRE